jgi:UDP-glucose 4-epimerase
LAALASTEKSKENPEATYKLNVQGTLRMLLLAELFKKKIIFTSSAAVYKDTGVSSYRETDELEGKSPYGTSKIEAEYLCAGFRNRIPIVVLRLFNVYGQGQNPEYAGVITSFLDQMKDGFLTIYGDGNQTRDFIHVTDVCRVIIDAVENDEWNGQIVNIGTGRATSINELATLFKNSTKSIMRVDHHNTRDEIKYSCADTRIMKQLFKRDLYTNLKENIKKLVKEYK